MNVQQLANLLYPNLTKTPQDWEKRFPKRNLPEGAEVTRVAPSPTGYLHLGTIFQAIIDKRLADQSGGVFLMRLEDTDKKREVEGAGDVAASMLRAYRLAPSEGYMGSTCEEKGNYGPYAQSQRLEIYHTYGKFLVEKGRAFPCFCQKTESKDDVLKNREQQLEENDDLADRDVCRNLTLEQIEQNLKEGKEWGLRLRSQGNADNTFPFFDMIKGEREVHENTKDVVLIKSNGIPVYAFGHAVDDHLMRVTTVVRGEEWYPSLAVHLEIFDALEHPRVKYAHTPVICKLDGEGNKRKLSKRKDPEADSASFLSAGYPVEAVTEYLTNLANSSFELWRLKNPDLPLADYEFRADNIGSNNPMFDTAKLDDYAKNYIARLDATTVSGAVTEYFRKNDKHPFSAWLFDSVYAKERKENLLAAMAIERGGVRPRKDIAKWSDIPALYPYLFPSFFQPQKEDYEIDFSDAVQSEKTKKVIEHYITVYRDYSAETEPKQAWFADVKDMAGKLGYATDNKAFKENPQAYAGNVANVAESIRLAVTGRKNSLDLFEICKVIGENEVKQRLLRLLKMFS